LLQSEGGKQTEPALASLPEQAHLMNHFPNKHTWWMEAHWGICSDDSRKH